jgi:CRP-like cAMP-binding protein
MDSRTCTDCELKSKAVQFLDHEELKILEKGCVEVMICRGENILRESNPSGHIIYLREGLVKLHMRGPRKTDQIIKIAKAGAYLGIQSLAGDHVSHYSVTAIADSKACFISIHTFKDLIRLNGLFATEMIHYICQEELAYFKRFLNQRQKQLNGRVAEALLQFRDEFFHTDSFRLFLTRNELAALIGATRESTTRTLTSFRSDSIIDFSGQDIIIRDHERLKKISEQG